MSKSGAEEKKKNEEEGVIDSNPPPGPTRLTRNRLLLHQLQQRKPSPDGQGVDDPKSGGTDNIKTKSKAKEDGGSKDRPPSSSPSLDNEEEASQTDKAKPEDSAPTMRPRPKRGEKNKQTKTPTNGAKDKGSKDGNQNVNSKNVLPMKTRATRSCNQPAANNNVAATKQQKKEGNENAKNIKKKKVNSSNNRRTKKKMYDESGALLANGKDYCDCLEVDCPGCHFPCKKCGSEKCGTECRCDRAWVYDEVKVEGTGIVIKNHAC